MTERKGVMRVGNDHTAPFSFERGFRQGCGRSSLLFIICGKKIMRLVEMTLKNRGGCIIGGRTIWNLRYADDTALLVTSPEELRHQVNELQKISLLFGLEINSAKTCMMVIDPADIGTQSAVDRWQRNRKSKQVRWGRWSRLTATVQQI